MTKPRDEDYSDDAFGQLMKKWNDENTTFNKYLNNGVFSLEPQPELEPLMVRLSQRVLDNPDDEDLSAAVAIIVALLIGSMPEPNKA